MLGVGQGAEWGKDSHITIGQGTKKPAPYCSGVGGDSHRIFQREDDTKLSIADE